MTGLLGYGGAYKAIHNADLLLMLGTDFPFSEFLPGDKVKKVQIERTRNTSDGEPRLIWRWSAISRAPFRAAPRSLSPTKRSHGIFLTRNTGPWRRS